MSLTARQEEFINQYLICRNAAEAARRAGYSEKTARTIGNQNLTKLDIQAEITRRTKENAMDADEALARLADMARGSIEEFVEVKPGVKNGVYLDFEKAKANGRLHLIKKLKYDRDGRPEIELYDAQSAAKIILDYLNRGPSGSETDPIHTINYIREVRPEHDDE